MFKLSTILSKNNDTFYDFRTNAPLRVAPRFISFFIISACCALLFGGNSDKFLNGVITVQAILIGFSFSVMFFLLSENMALVPPSGSSIEKGIKTSKLLKLSKEIFYNISYFNIVAIGCLTSALLLLLPNATIHLFAFLQVSGKWACRAHDALYIAGVAVNILILFVFYFLLIESAYTFVRTIGRVNYLFEQKILLRNDG